MDKKDFFSGCSTTSYQPFALLGSLPLPPRGTMATSSLAIRVNQHFLQRAETNLGGSKLLSAIARDKKSHVEIFRSECLRDDPAATMTSPVGHEI
jgi:hypothetical protein